VLARVALKLMESSIYCVMYIHFDCAFQQETLTVSPDHAAECVHCAIEAKLSHSSNGEQDHNNHQQQPEQQQQQQGNPEQVQAQQVGPFF